MQFTNDPEPSGFLPQDAAMGAFGEEIDGYKLKRFCGHGPVSWVYEAEKPGGGVLRLKVLDRAAFVAPGEFDRILTRCTALRNRLNHANVAAPLGANMLGQEHCYLVEEWKEGITLRKLLKRSRRLSEQAALALLRLVAKGILHGHEQGIIHGGVKATNVIIGRTGSVYSVDWASPRTAILASSGALRLPFQQVEVEIGYAYLPPEVLHGEIEPKPVADVYALGILLYELIAGEAPFAGPPDVLLKLIRERSPLTFADDSLRISDPTQDLLQWMTAYAPEARCEQMGECVQALEEALEALKSGEA